jgi:4a-hydroxytetrahydrobiopterin dehydratase
MADLLTDNQITSHLKTMPGWSLLGKEIHRTFERKDFVAAMGFVTQVAIIAERADHHPDIDIRWNKVTITLSTHSAGGITAKDFTLAQEIDEL